MVMKSETHCGQNAYSSDELSISAAKIKDNQLIIDWLDNHQSEFHSIWLRHQCACKQCGTPLDAVRALRLHHIPENITPTVESWTREELLIRWPDHHLSTYNARWLRMHCYSQRERSRRKHRPILWNNRIIENLPTADFETIENDSGARLSMLHAVCDYGFCLIQNAPTSPKETDRMISLVGPQRRTNFGTYPLAAKKAVDNVGDTTDPLDPHTDESYRLSTIGITVFQVLRPATSGGDSTLVDGFEAARRLRESWPDAFDLLAHTPVAAERFDQAHNTGGHRKWYRARMPLIRLDEDGDVVGVRLNERQIAPLDLSPDQIEPCYRAMKKIFSLLYEPAMRITIPLKAGEGLIFNNQRLLHGRTGFEVESPGREVLTSSVDMEEFYSTIRLLEG